MNSDSYIETCENPAIYSNQLYKLYLNVALRNDDSNMPYLLNENFINNLEELMSGEFEIRIAKHETNIIGFTLALQKGLHRSLRFIGLDYNYTKNTALYFNLIYDSIERAIEKKNQYLHLGVTENNIKPLKIIYEELWNKDTLIKKLNQFLGTDIDKEDYAAVHRTGISKKETESRFWIRYGIGLAKLKLQRSFEKF